MHNDSFDELRTFYNFEVGAQWKNVYLPCCIFNRKWVIENVVLWMNIFQELSIEILTSNDNIDVKILIRQEHFMETNEL